MVQSTDKNFMVPVGGAVVVSPSPAFIDAVAGCYPGRASMTPVLDLFITLLSMGQEGYRGLLQERLRLRRVMLQGLQVLCDKHALAILPAPGNSISTGVSLASLLTSTAPVQMPEEGVTGAAADCVDAPRSGAVTDDADGGAQPSEGITAEGVSAAKLSEAEEKTEQTTESTAAPPAQPQEGVRMQQTERLSFLGSMLFQRCVSGCRVVTCTGEAKKVAGMQFVDWGAHSNSYPCSYFTVACSVGIQDRDVALFLERLDKVLVKYKKQYPAAGEVSVMPSS